MRRPPVIIGYPANYVHPPPSQGGYNPGYPPAFPGENPSGKVPPNLGTNSVEDQTEGEFNRFDFSEKSVRRGFIRKVYGILMLQLLFTVGLICLFLYYCPLKEWVSCNTDKVLISSITIIVLTIVLIISMSCCPTLRRRAPINYILLFLLTALLGILVASAATLFDSNEVLIAAGITTVVCFAVTVFAFQTKWEFNVCNGILFVSLIVLLQFGIVTPCMNLKTVNVAYASLGALIYSVYLVYDTQMIIGGEHSYQISPEEYVFAALILYLDVINMFLHILRIISCSRS
ncbi:protein lifeguard 1-like [Neodiprion lecontei]|uniref:Protein lifeguard 1-like n=1 Tax=Neodiprion lecontei TaxID=441921 RepID=A0A6J0CA52_NEOLC|nr:protein lifeguard 1-like [Neodiprion lecontei]